VEILALRQQLAAFQKNARASSAATGSCGLCCTDFGPVGGDVSRGPVRLRRAIAWAKPGGALRGNGASHTGLDYAADAGSVSLG
jgi:hypothetical protein